jgi:nucleoside-diphosphate-sugar epimerase
MAKTALLVGGSAATGVCISKELLDRGFDVKIYHTGRHEVPEIAELEHIHGDPHHRETIARDLAGRSFDVVVATYGRIRYLVDELKGRTGQFVSVSGMPVMAAVAGVPLTEHAAYETVADAPLGLKGLIPRIIDTEHAVLGVSEQGELSSSVVRYPYVYGPHSAVPMEWHVIQRVLDRRRRWIIQGAGLQLVSRCASPNAARIIGLVIDNPSVARGQVYCSADTRQFSMREWIEMIALALDWQFEFVDIPTTIVPMDRSVVPMAGEAGGWRESDVRAGRHRNLVVSTEKARREIGFTDAVEPSAWIRRTVEFWLDNPPVVDGRNGRLSMAEFDYAAEDALLDFWDRVVAQAPQLGSPLLRGHAYEHPKQPLVRDIAQ